MEEYSEKFLVLARYLGLEDNDEIIQIEELDDNNFSCEGEDYEIYSDLELDNLISELIQDKIEETQYEINNRVDLPNDVGYENARFMRVEVDEDAIEYEFREDFGYHIGNYDNDYVEFEDFYIFKK